LYADGWKKKRTESIVKLLRLTSSCDLVMKSLILASLLVVSVLMMSVSQAEAYEGKVKFQNIGDENSEQGDIIVIEGFIAYYYTPEITITIFETNNPSVVIIEDTVKIDENAEFTNEVSDRLWPFSYEVNTGDSRLYPEIGYTVYASFEDKSTTNRFSFNPTMAQQVITESTNPIYNNTPEQAKNADTIESSSNANAVKDTKIPEWIDTVFRAYTEKQITQAELISALQFLIKSGILVV